MDTITTKYRSDSTGTGIIGVSWPIFTDDICDCDQRCKKCGKLKRGISPYRITWGETQQWDDTIIQCSC